MITRTDLIKIARGRLKDAEILLAAGRYDGAIYLGGYVVEISLKNRICKTLKWSGFLQTPSERRRRSVAPHADFVVVASDHHHDQRGGAASPLETPRLGFGDHRQRRWLPVSEFQNYQSFKTHKLNVLLRLSGVEAKIRASYFAEWSTVAAWDPEMRYNPIGSTSQTEAELMIEAAKILLRAL